MSIWMILMIFDIFCGNNNPDICDGFCGNNNPDICDGFCGNDYHYDEYDDFCNDW